LRRTGQRSDFLKREARRDRELALADLLNRDAARAALAPGFAERVAVPRRNLLAKPAGLSFADGLRASIDFLM
jgi:NADPH:quinone reductase-like Zn-dependent oxidoreductase